MAKSLNILFVGSELFPLAKESGIADIMYALPIALRELGHDVRVIFPKYGIISDRKHNIHNINRLRDIYIKIGDQTYEATIKSSIIPGSRFNLQSYLISNDYFFDNRKGIYHDQTTWEEYPDNLERFIFFNKAVVETCSLLGWTPNIIHCHDWQSALIPALIKEIYYNKYKKTKIVFTIHNFFRQGEFSLKDFSKLGLPDDALIHFKHKNKLNFMKGALEYANYITTVSQNYANEILKDRFYSNGLNDTLKKKKNIYKGIINGVDNVYWNPKKDEFLKYKLKDNIEEFKLQNKNIILKEFNFDDNLEIPLLGMIPRIGYQKGTQLLIDAADQIFKNNLRIVLLGEGDNYLKEQLKNVANKYKDKFKLRFEFNEPLSHIIEAGCDFFLMPSQYEPFGLNFAYSLLYGAIPIARKTGGLADLSDNIDFHSGKGNSIVFEKYEVQDFVDAIERALKLYHNKDLMKKIIYRNMNSDFSWSQSAKEYESIYKFILKEQNKENE